MPSVQKNDEVKDKSLSTFERLMLDAVNNVNKVPQVVCGVGRRITTVQYEHIDVFFGVTLPVINADLGDVEKLKEQLNEVATEGFMIASKETGERYLLIKDALKGGIEEPAAEEEEPK